MPQGGPEGAFIRTPGRVVESVCNLIAGAAARVTMVVLLGAFLRPALPAIRRFRFLARPLARKFARWGLHRHQLQLIGGSHSLEAHAALTGQPLGEGDTRNSQRDEGP
jgi:hypothetical protein